MEIVNFFYGLGHSHSWPISRFFLFQIEPSYDDIIHALVSLQLNDDDKDDIRAMACCDNDDVKTKRILNAG